MSYEAGEAAIATLVQAATGFSSANVARSNWKLLNQGKDDNYAIIHPGSFEIEWRAFSMYHIVWRTVVEIYQRYKDETSTQTSLYGHVYNVITHLQKYPNLSATSGVSDASVTGAGEPEEMWKSGGGPSWLKWSVVIEWREEITPALAE